MRPRDRRFVAAYLHSADAERAARAAGYAPRRAAFHGARLLAKAEVRDAVRRARRDRAERFGLTVERVLLEYARLALADLARVLAFDGADLRPRPLLGLNADDAAAIAAVTFGKDGTPVNLALHAKDFALEALALYFNLLDGGGAREENAGARERLLARLEAMTSAEDAAAEMC